MSFFTAGYKLERGDATCDDCYIDIDTYWVSVVEDVILCSSCVSNAWASFAYEFPLARGHNEVILGGRGDTVDAKTALKLYIMRRA